MRVGGLESTKKGKKKKQKKLITFVVWYGRNERKNVVFPLV